MINDLDSYRVVLLPFKDIFSQNRHEKRAYFHRIGSVFGVFFHKIRIFEAKRGDCRVGCLGW